MRVVLDGHPLLSQLFGIGHYTIQLIEALALGDPLSEFVVLYPHAVHPFDGRPAPAFHAQNVRVAEQSWWRSMNVRVRRRLGVGISVEQLAGAADVFHGPNYLLSYPVRSAKRVITVHDLTLVLFPQWHPPERLQEMLPRLGESLRLADRIVVDSESTKRDLVEHMPVEAERVSVVPLAPAGEFRPLPADQLRPALAPYGLAPDGYLLFVGTIEPRKNLGRLFDALEAVGPEAGPLVIAGATGWGYEDILRRMRRLEREGRVRYLGYVPQAFRPMLMSGARLFLYPSLYEGFGLPVLEAMSCGTPVIASNVSSLPEVVGAGGLMVDPCDVEALADAIRRLWADGALRATLGARAVEQARRFSWEETARLTLDAYRAAMAT